MAQEATTENLNISVLRQKLPPQFGCRCSCCGNVKKMRQDVFLARVERLKGDVQTLVANYHCNACRRKKNVDIVGRGKVASGVRVVTIEDII